MQGAAIVVLALAVGSACQTSGSDPRVSADEWIAALRKVRAQTADVAKAHLAVMDFVDRQVLASELALVCRTVQLAARDARLRARVAGDSPRGRMRRAVLGAVASRLQAQTVCPRREGRDIAVPGRVDDLSATLDRATALLDLAPAEVTAAEQALLEEERRGGDLEEAFAELADWVSRHDEVVRKLAALNLALRHARRAHASGEGARSFERLSAVLDGRSE
jgi:hypothetical protein